MKSERGFTVIELIFVIAIVGLLTSLAVFSTVKWIHRTEVRIFAMKLLSDLEWARSLAFRYGNSTVKFNNSSDDFNGSYTLSADNFTIQRTVPKGIRMKASERLLSGQGLQFRRNGLPDKNGHILITDKDKEEKYLICINKIAGRIKLIKAKSIDESEDDCNDS